MEFDVHSRLNGRIGIAGISSETTEDNTNIAEDDADTSETRAGMVETLPCAGLTLTAARGSYDPAHFSAVRGSYDPARTMGPGYNA